MNMKKYLHPKFLPILVPVAGLLGLLLRLWIILPGPDPEGLYAPQPFAWTLLWIVTILTLAAVVVMSARLKVPGKYTDNFPASVPGAIGSALAALGIILSKQVFPIGSDLLSTLTSILGIISAAVLVLAALNRYQGKKSSFLLHAIPCLFFALRIFMLCRVWSSETQTGVFLFQFFASICVMLASYQLACFDVNLGKRRSSLFWSLSGVYFCLLALPGSNEPLFYAAMALWLLTNLCSLWPMKARKPQTKTPAESAAPEQEPPTPTSAAENGLREDMSLDELKSWLDQE
jgi:hypothetical protein